MFQTKDMGHGTRDTRRPELHCGILDFLWSKDDLPLQIPSRSSDPTLARYNVSSFAF